MFFICLKFDIFCWNWKNIVTYFRMEISIKIELGTTYVRGLVCNNDEHLHGGFGPCFPFSILFTFPSI